jgi:hypothetical protein
LSMASQIIPPRPVITDAVEQAAAMNAAAHDLLLSLQATMRPSAAESWSDNIAKACGDFVAAFGAPAIRSATRLGLEPDDLRRFGDMLHMARRVRSAAFRYSGNASAAKATATVKRPAAENAWLIRMAEIYLECFGRRPGITKDPLSGKRDGHCPRFISEVAKRLRADCNILAPPNAWTAVLDRFSAPKLVAGRLEAIGREARAASASQ